MLLHLITPISSNLEICATARQKEKLALPSLVSDTSPSISSEICASALQKKVVTLAKHGSTDSSEVCAVFLVFPLLIRCVDFSIMINFVGLFLQDGGCRGSDLVDAFEKLALHDDKSVHFSYVGSSSSEASDDFYGDLQGLHTEKLNQFLTACGKEEKVLGQPKKRWENLSKQRRNVYVARATTAIVAALDVITPGDAGHLWTAVKSSCSVDTALEIDVDRRYLEALAETYQHATGWDTRRQVLAIMADLVPVCEIKKFIPGLTDYRVKEARLHILKYGRGAPVPLK